jgi:adhesin transport system outer membrane protein
MRTKPTRMLLTTAALMLAASAHQARGEGGDLVSAVQAALNTNPEINQAVRNREAIDFERKQAQGQFLPRISVEGSAGVRRLQNDTRRSLNIANDTLYPLEAGVRAQQILFDGGSRTNEVRRQASRSDGAAWRVMERSQFIALQVARQYLDHLLQQRIVAAAEDNTTFHEKLLGDLREGVKNGSISIADQQQAEERLRASRARLTEARQDLTDAASSFRTLTGLEIDNAALLPASLRPQLPASLTAAVDLARTGNPRLREAQADLDAASALARKARADTIPTLSLEGGARIGEDIDGFRGQSNDLNAGVVMRWDVFSGGIRRNTVLEQVRRESEARFRVEQFQREAEQDMRVAWNALQSQSQLTDELDKQSHVSDDVLVSYREQFNVGRRSLLDVLDAQNTRFNVQVRAETARFSAIIAEFKILAAANQLIETLGVKPPAAAIADQRAKFKVRPASVQDGREIARDDTEANLKPEPPTY